MPDQQDGVHGFLSPRSTAITASVLGFLVVLVLVLGYGTLFPEHSVTAIVVSLVPATAVYVWQIVSLLRYQYLRLSNGEVIAIRSKDVGNNLSKLSELSKMSHWRWVLRYFGSPFLLGLLGLVLLMAH